MTTFSDHLVRDATRYVLKREYRPGVVKSAVLIVIAVVIVLCISAGGVISNATMWGLLSGVAVAAILVALVYLVGYRQNLRFSSLVFRNEGTGEVFYELSEVGCRVRYKAGEILLPWRLLRSRESYGEYELLAFGPSENDSDRARVRDTLDAISRGAAGPELLGFPIFCAVPRPRTRY
ncbi:MAG: hypothetical protein ACREMY_06205, partial [bacterium]